MLKNCGRINFSYSNCHFCLQFSLLICLETGICFLLLKFTVLSFVDMFKNYGRIGLLVIEAYFS